MFNLEREVARWRDELAAAGIKSAGILDELEAHVREDVERRLRLGADPRQAFLASVSKLGGARALFAEYEKNHRERSLGEILMMVTSALLLAMILLLSTAAVVMCLSTWRERTIATAAVLATLFVAFAWGHAVRLLPVIDSARLRWGAGLGCIASGFLAGSMFCEIILPLLGAGPGVPRFDLALWAVFLVAVFFCAGVGLLLRGSEWNRGASAVPPKTVS